ncbi:PepSY-associated TM helix domain-containing protein [Asticcacaulis machinosus]|uniref:PepSY domain-containing protein n=1 Tax=Asticcacaulis machinosus TaxID=2984211 RepID=A0ABT5HF54_9CAUL|nr:PepSY domain-containing protein [Asticcacaulis machinosus]MDC7674882.1 PepSY domain-containing protein [Asticcacaulis machinosus]
MEPAANDKVRRRIIDYRMIWRWHFYAGLFCIPFIIILTLTGTTYLFKPQIEAVLEAKYNNLAFDGAPKPVSQQIYTAMHAMHGASLTQVEIRDNPHDALRVTLNDGGELYRLYVHPQSLDILKAQPLDERFMVIIKNIHGELTIGKPGEIIVELAASWAIVMIITGLYLWWPRQVTGWAGVLWPRLNGGSRLFWRDLHAVTGIYISTFALILLLSGLPWTSVWGTGFKAVVAATKPTAAKAEWSSNRAQDKQQVKNEHAHHGVANPAKDIGADMGTDLTGVDALIPVVRSLNLPAPIIIKPDSERMWQAGSATQNLTARRTVTLDANTGEIVKQTGFAEKALMDKVVLTAITLHEGHLFGWFNQLLGLLTAVGLLTLSISAVIMWWSKRPADRLGAPVRLDGKHDRGLLFIILIAALFLPVMGLSLALIALLERFILRRIPSVRSWLGLT